MSTFAPFHFDFHEDDFEDLRRRMAATRWPEQEPEILTNELRAAFRSLR